MPSTADSQFPKQRLNAAPRQACKGCQTRFARPEQYSSLLCLHVLLFCFPEALALLKRAPKCMIDLFGPQWADLHLHSPSPHVLSRGRTTEHGYEDTELGRREKVWLTFLCRQWARQGACGADFSLVHGDESPAAWGCGRKAQPRL